MFVCVCLITDDSAYSFYCLTENLVLLQSMSLALVTMSAKAHVLVNLAIYCLYILQYSPMRFTLIQDVQAPLEGAHAGHFALGRWPAAKQELLFSVLIS